jgi:LCP family protein required for cell wall assembly
MKHHSDRARSVDGFVPHNRRQVGGQMAGDEWRRQRQPAERDSLPRPAVRPNSNNDNSFQAQRTVGDDVQRQPRRSNFPEFNTYAGTNNNSLPQAGNTGRHRRGGQEAENKKEKGFFRRQNWKKIAKVSGAAVGILVLLTVGWLGWNLYRNSNKALGSGNLFGFLNSTPLKGQNGRTNILLAGVSTDDPGHQGANLTDSIMLISLDTRNHKATLISIPRDLWVKIPGYGHAKINVANSYGDQSHFSQPGYPPGGIGLLEETLSEKLQIPINYYAKINYAAFRDMVNAVGGIKVTIHSPDPRGLFDPNISKHDGGPLRLTNGTHVLNGQTALNLARARGDPCGCGQVEYGFPHSDFDRTKHQRMMLVALKQKIASPGVIANPIKLGKLFGALGKNVQTDFKPSEIHRLYDLSKQIANHDIKSVSFDNLAGKNLLQSYRSPDGESALIPAAGYDNFSAIQQQLNRILSNDPVVKEAASVVVLNGGHISGLATHESNILTKKGMGVEAIGNAREPHAHNLIIDQSNGKKPHTLQFLKKRYGAHHVSTTPNPSYPHADFVIILGEDRPDSTSQ